MQMKILQILQELVCDESTERIPTLKIGSNRLCSYIRNERISEQRIKLLNSGH